MAAQLALDDIGAPALARDVHVRFEEFAETTVNVSVNYFAPRVVDKERTQSAVLRRFYELLQRSGIASPILHPVRQGVSLTR